MEKIIKAVINEHHQIDVSQDIDLDLVEHADGSYHVIHDGKSLQVNVLSVDRLSKKMKLDIDGSRYEIDLKDEVDVMVEKMGLNDIVASGAEDCKAPMPGLVLEVQVEVDQEVTVGMPLLILEAMKMENVIKASHNGTIQEVLVSAGDKVEKGQVMINYK